MKAALKSSASSRRSRKPARPAGKRAAASLSTAPLLFLAAASAIAVLAALANGWTLYYGDAEAHLNIARRITDSRQPGYEQIGTVWLPLPHLLAMPLAKIDAAWRSGLAGAIPSAVCFLLTGLFLYGSLRRVFEDAAPAWAGLLALALNPNLLYLQATPMTEATAMMSLTGVLFFTLRFEATQSWGDAALAGFAALAGTLTRYEVWVILPLAAFWIAWRGGPGRWGKALLFCVLSGAGPVYWLAHNQYFFSNALEFYNGPWSAKAIYRRSLEAGGFRYPGDHDWLQAWRQYRAAAELCAGLPLAWIGAAGLLAALWKRAWWAALLLFSVPAFYVVSLYSSGTPIFVPNLWPNSYYNTRYGISALPLFCLGIAGAVAILGARLRVFAAIALTVACLSPWVLYPRKENWVTWKESQLNSRSRRAWTAQASTYLRAHYRRGAGIWMSFGDLTGVLRSAGIPIRESLHEGDGLVWEAAAQRPDLFLREEWALARSGDRVSRTLKAHAPRATRYVLAHVIEVEGESAVEIWRRAGR